jgi:hypothetical protein
MDSNIGLISILPMPIKEKSVNVAMVRNWICHIIECDDPIPRRCIAYIEGVNAMPGQGVVSMFKFGFVTGQLESIFRMLNIELYRVYPVKWKNSILGKGKHIKQDSVTYCQEHYPHIPLLRTIKSRVPDHNIADAICIAEYGVKYHEPK